MQSSKAVTCGLAQEPRAEPARANELESDGEEVSETGSSMVGEKMAQSMESCLGEILCFQDGRRRRYDETTALKTTRKIWTS